MQLAKLMTLVATVTALAGCAGGIGNFGTRAGPPKDIRAVDLPSFEVVGIMVNVPETLSVSEANSYKPNADIVWRGDPLGDRHVQVKEIFEAATAEALAGIDGNLPIVVHVDVRKFHALTQKTRATVGGTHAMDFFLTVTNGETGDVVINPFFVSTNLRGFGGQAAMVAEARGNTQKARIIEHLTSLIRQELTTRPVPAVDP